MTHSHIPRKILSRHTFKTRRATSLILFIKKAFMVIITHSKFDFNQFILTFIFGIRATEPPVGPGERLKRPGPDRVKHLFLGGGVGGGGGESHNTDR